MDKARKLLTLLLCTLMCISTLQLAAFAEDEPVNKEDVSTETTLEDGSKEDTSAKENSADVKEASKDEAATTPSEDADKDKSIKRPDAEKEGPSDIAKDMSDKDDSNVDVEKEAPSDYPAFSKTAKVDGVSISVSASKGVFPEGSTLSVKKAALSESQKKAIDAERDKDDNVASSYSFDIKILDKDSNEIQPADGKKVDVSFAIDEAANSNLEANIYHHEKSGSVEALDTEIAKGEVTAETTGFSVYTVEFTYGDLEYVLNGGEEIALSEILSSLNITGEVSNAVSSAPELFSVSKKSGNWIVKPHKAFTSEETLIVTVDGIDMIINVTDAQTIDIGTMDQFQAAFKTAHDNPGEYIFNIIADLRSTVPASQDYYVIAGETITIIGNGHTLTVTNGYTPAVAGGTLNLGSPTVNNSGFTWKNNGGSSSQIYNAIVSIGSSGGTINMYDGVTLTGRSNRTNGVGCAVEIQGGTFNMYGGSISNNVMYRDSSWLNAATGGAVGVNGSVAGTSPVFNMYGGTISNNQNTNTNSAGSSYGGGVTITGGTFNMSGGTVTGNSVKGSGGGFMIHSGTLNMSGGGIHNNSAAVSADDIYMDSGATVKLVDGSSMGATLISKNKAITGWYEDNQNDRWSPTNATELTSFTPSGQNSIKAAYGSDPSASIKFKIVGGTWSDGTTADKSVVLTGSNLTLASSQIPNGTAASGYSGSGTWTVSATSGTAPSNATPNTTTTFRDGDAIVYTLTFTPDATSHKLTYTYEGEVPNGAPAKPGESNVEPGEEVTVAAVPTMTGYTFSGWTTDDVTISGGKFTMPDKDVTLKGSWTVNKHKITYKYSGPVPSDAEQAPEQVLEYEYGKEYTLLAPDAVEGYTFSGWSVESPNGLEIKTRLTSGTSGLRAPISGLFSGIRLLANSAADTPTNKYFVMPDADVVLVGTWTINQHTITFDTKGGNTIAPITQDYGTDVTAPANPTREGYTFDGWDKTIPSTMPDEDVTITAKWKINKHDVSYEYTGTPPAGAPAVPGTVSTEYGTEVTVANAPTLDGYTFSGWTTQDVTVTDGKFTMPDKAVKLVGTWVAVGNTPYKVEHYTEKLDGSYEKHSTDTLSGKTDTTATANPIHIDHYTYDPSNTSNVVSGTIKGDGTLVLKLYYKLDRHTIKFVDADGRTLLGDKEYPYGTSKDDIQKPADPTKPADKTYTYTFKGWTPEIDDVTGDVTYTAVYDKTYIDYTVRFVDEDGTELQKSTLHYGDTPKYTGNTPEKKADADYTYKFIGWTPVISPVTGDTVYKAVYEKTRVTHNVDFDSNGGTNVPGQAIGNGDKATKPSDPYKEGYTFGGWYTDPECTVPYDFNSPVTGDLKLYAKWIENNADTSDDPDDDADDSKTKKSTNKSPKTGDENNLAGWFTVMGLAAGTSVILYRRRRKGDDN